MHRLGPTYKDEIENGVGLDALAQHYSLSTRLLDWTESPYVAAFFAFSGHLKMGRGLNESGLDRRVAVWILDTRATAYWNGDHGVTILSPKTWHNERRKRQSGCFTEAKMTQRTLEDYALAMGNQENALRKITLPAKDARLALEDLNMMRINARELFDDLQGAANAAYVRAVLANDVDKIE